MVTKIISWFSSAVVKVCLRIMGIEVSRGMSTIIDPYGPSIPKDIGSTFMSSKSFFSLESPAMS